MSPLRRRADGIRVNRLWHASLVALQSSDDALDDASNTGALWTPPSSATAG